jgi:hypothetical protein
MLPANSPWQGKLLEVEGCPEGTFVTDYACARAIIWECDASGYLSIIDIYEANDARLVVSIALQQHPDTYFAKSRQKVVAPDEISVGECACAMAGIW